jgi:transposase
MFLKRISKVNKATGLPKDYFRLCESYRSGNTVRHYTIIQLGALDELPAYEQKQTLARRIEQLVDQHRTGKLTMFAPTEDLVERLARKFFADIEEKRRLDIASGKDYHVVDVNSVKNKQVREVGAEWLCFQAVEQLKIPGFLRQQEWDEEMIRLAMTHIVSRAVYPASELRTSHWIKENSAICELTGYPEHKINKDRLYAISHQLYSVKDDLEKHLSNRTNELFDLDDKIILYDLTNTYFEGRMSGSKLAGFGRSKEKRNDAKLVVLGVVVNTEGFLKYSNIYEGNTADSTTLAHIIEQMSRRTSVTGRKPVVVLDAGIATEDNIKLLRDNDYDYICVSRAKLKNYKADTSKSPVVVLDNKEQPITLRKVRVEGCPDNYLQVHSYAKALKENSMNTRFANRFEEGLQQIKDSLNKKSGIKKLSKVWERIGRLKAKYPSIHKYYDICVKDDSVDTVTELTWQKKQMDKQEGTYFLRTNLNEKDEHTQWTIYNTIREIEYTFRVLKTDLDLRPVFHKTDAASMAHLHLGLLAYWVVNTLRHQLKQKGINNEWRDTVRIMNTQKAVTTTMKNDRYEQIVIRQCSDPTEDVQRIYKALGYKTVPFHRKKFVVPPAEIRRTQLPDNDLGLSG